MKDIFDGVCVFTMNRDKPIPQKLDTDGFHVKVSYYGQSVECDICKNHGHVARDCPLKGRCLWCHQPRHLQRDCTNPWAGDNSDVGSAEGRSPSGPPAPVNVDTSPVSGSQASEGVPSGRPSENVTADSQPLFSADESSEPSDKHINTSSCETENIEMENTESNIVNDKECGYEEVLSKDESSSIFTAKIATDLACAQRRYPCNTSGFSRQCYSRLQGSHLPIYANPLCFSVSFAKLHPSGPALNFLL